VSQKLESFSGAKKATPVETIIESDTQSFLKSERENAILSIVDEVKKSTLESVEKLYWSNVESEWESEKLRILNALVGTSPDEAPEPISLDSFRKPPSSRQSVGSMSASFVTPQEEANFINTVSRYIREKKSIDHLIGYISEDGCRIPGELDSHQANPEPIIEKISLECERQGFFEEAVKLYDLAYNHNKVIKLLNRLLSGVIAEKSGDNPKRDRLEENSLKLAERFSILGHKASQNIMATFYLLLDLMTFFSYYHKQTVNDALNTIEKLKVVPFRSSEIDLKVSEFSQLPEEIRHNIPEILLASMNILYVQFKETRASVPQSANKFGITSESSFRDQRCSEIREKARALITYAGMIPYRMPGNTNAKLIQMEVLMH